MATYEELYDLRTESELRNKVAVAVSIKAHAVLGEASPGAERKDWAEVALGNIDAQVDTYFTYVLADNNAATVDQIKNATDTLVQNNVDEAVDAIYPPGV